MGNKSTETKNDIETKRNLIEIIQFAYCIKHDNKKNLSLGFIKRNNTVWKTYFLNQLST